MIEKKLPQFISTVDFSTLKSFKQSIQTMDLSGYCIGSIYSVVLVLDVDCV